ncbi:MAG: ABC transporter permease [Dysgonamonadaceae bacterium]|jgi:lipoprotein-releasing system permease protein|nr:ABC transporter permease [Dysgonamonadaceae bacterium]
MQTPLFIAQRIYFSKDGEKRVSPPAIRIAIVSMALGLAVMILAVAIVTGFKKEVRNKVIGFGSHIQITHFDSNRSYETRPIAVSDSLLNALRAFPNIRRVQAFATKPAIIKTDNDFQGVVLKGVDEHFDWDFFQTNLKEGTVLDIRPDATNNNVLISSTIAAQLNLKTGDSFICYFIQDPPRARKYTVAGIYQTHFAEYDQLFILGDIRQIRRLSDWDEDMASGLELLIDNYDNLDATFETLYYDLSVQTDRLGNHYYPCSIKQLHPMIFAWLDVLNINVVVILLLMALVAGFSMISGLLIIILERAPMIGILKAMGENNTGIRKIFLYLSVFLIGKGLLWGNLIALTICIVQKLTGILTLNPEVYYVPEVPIELNIWSLLLINAGAFIATLLMLIGPSYLVAKISPAKTIRFE